VSNGNTGSERIADAGKATDTQNPISIPVSNGVPMFNQDLSNATQRKSEVEKVINGIKQIAGTHDGRQAIIKPGDQGAFDAFSALREVINK